jgi:Zn-dependent metalloprotease
VGADSPGANNANSARSQVFNIAFNPAIFGTVVVYPNLYDIEIFALQGLPIPAPTADDSARNAFRNSLASYQFFSEHFGLQSFDGKGSNITSVVHMGVGWGNAAWLGGSTKTIVYGDGDGTERLDFSRGLDIGGHEFTHAVVENTAGLIYSGESGAINESMADFFGKMIEYEATGSLDWELGTAIYGSGSKQKAMRSMENPEKYDQPAHNRSKKRVATTTPCGPSNDSCGVHANSGIPNFLSYLIHTALGHEKTIKLYYLVLSEYLTESSDFSNLKSAIISASEKQFGKNSSDTFAVRTLASLIL